MIYFFLTSYGFLKLCITVLAILFVYLASCIKIHNYFMFYNKTPIFTFVCLMETSSNSRHMQRIRKELGSIFLAKFYSIYTLNYTIYIMLFLATFIKKH